MFQSSALFDDYYKDKTKYYDSLAEQLGGLLSIETDPVTNMAQTSAFIFQSIPQLNWAGFYLAKGLDKLMLGPFQGKVACVHIPYGKGVCGTVAKTQQSICVNDVHQFPTHIACDSASNSEIVVPVMVGQTFIGVLDIDSPEKNRFDDNDVNGFEKLVGNLVAATNFSR